MDLIDKNLNIIADCIRNNMYKEVETHRFELKDLSGGWGKDWYKSVCAFLNTNGGIVVIGINDNDRVKPHSYKLTGYANSKDNENHLKQELPKKFTDSTGKPIDLSTYISKFEIRDFLGGKIAIIYVEELAADEKFAYYNGEAYTRKLTGDYPLTKTEIIEYEELKKDIVRHQELSLVKEVGLDVLSLDTLNEYIYEFNKGKKRGETYKRNLEEALSFLNREGFVRENSPTVLGMLVCGNHVENYIQGKFLNDGEIKLYIPKGKVFDDAMASWLNSFSGYIIEKYEKELEEDEKIMLSFFYKSEMLNRLENYTILLTMDNNHKEIIANLEEKGLIFRNAQSPDIHPIYLVDRILIKKDFSNVLKSMFSNDYILLKPDYQEVLQAIYLHNTYTAKTEPLSANSIGTFIYAKNNKNIIDLNEYENFKRKVRNIFNQLESKKLIVRKDGKAKIEGGKPDFEINPHYKQSNDLFNSTP